MLYERWLQIAQAHLREVALRDLLTGQQWTFAELDGSAQQKRAGDGPIAFPQSRGPEFVIAVLQAWRRNLVVCPLEPGQVAPRFSAELPKEIRHIKLTSATTGSSRLVAFTDAQLIADAQNIVSTMELRPDWP